MLRPKHLKKLLSRRSICPDPPNEDPDSAGTILFGSWSSACVWDRCAPLTGIFGVLVCFKPHHWLDDESLVQVKVDLQGFHKSVSTIRVRSLYFFVALETFYTKHSSYFVHQLIVLVWRQKHLNRKQEHGLCFSVRIVYRGSSIHDLKIIKEYQ